MRETSRPQTGRTSDTFRLRREVYDRLVEAHGAQTMDAQVRLTGVTRATLYRVKGGTRPSLPTAMRIAEALGVPMTALFERKKSAA